MKTYKITIEADTGTIATLCERVGRTEREVFIAALACYDLLTELEAEGEKIKILGLDGVLDDLDISRLDAVRPQRS